MKSIRRIHKNKAFEPGNKVILTKTEQGIPKGTVLTVVEGKKERKPYTVKVKNNLGEKRDIRSKYLDKR